MEIVGESWNKLKWVSNGEFKSSWGPGFRLVVMVLVEGLRSQVVIVVVVVGKLLVM